MNGEARERVRERVPESEIGDVERLGKMVVSSAKDFMRDSGPQWAAAIAYYSLLSVPPLLLAIASIAAFFVNPQWAIDQATRLLEEFLPQGSDQIESVITNAIEARGSVSLLSIGSLLWTGTRVFGVITKALNIAFTTRESYSFFKRTLIEFVMLLTVGLLFVLALAAPPTLDLLRNVLEVLPAENALLDVTVAVVPMLLLMLAFFLIYRYVPRRDVSWEAALLGAALATLLFLAARPLFTTYVRRFANYNLIYGSLAIVVIMVFWAWIVGVILLFSGEVAAHTQSMLLEKQTQEHVEQEHRQLAPTLRQDEEGNSRKGGE
jgi:membrane protein